VGRYLLQRLGTTLAVVLTLITFLSILVHLIPGDPVALVMGPRASPEFAQQVRAEMGLDDAVPVQVWNFFSGAIQGDLGNDFVSNVPVTEIVFSNLPHTLLLAFAALGMAAVIGIPLGVLTATRPNSILDRITSLISVSFITMPSYVSGLFLLLLFALMLDVLPATGAGDITDPIEYLRHLILPASALAITWVGYLARIVRTSMLEVMGENYIRAARALGLRERLIAYRYALKNAVIPTIALLGVSLGDLFGGTVFVEVIFSRPGLGTLIVDAISERNYPIVRGGVLVIAVLFVTANLLADLSYRSLDPRVRVTEGAA
jgi:peptide/nickel transport system permease protein